MLCYQLCKMNAWMNTKLAYIGITTFRLTWSQEGWKINIDNDMDWTQLWSSSLSSISIDDSDSNFNTTNTTIDQYHLDAQVVTANKWRAISPSLKRLSGHMAML